MNDSIKSIRAVPQINILNPRGRTGDKKGNKENKKDFSKYMSGVDKEVEGAQHNNVKEDNSNTEHKIQNDTNSLQEKKEDDFDDSCGTFLDAEV